MATVTVHFLDKVVTDANGRVTFGFVDESLAQEQQVIANGATFEFTAPEACMFVIVETDANCRYAIAPTDGVYRHPINAASPPLEAGAFRLQGPIQLRAGWKLNIQAYG